MNIILKMTLNEYLAYLTRLISLGLLLSILFTSKGLSQEYYRYTKFVPQSYSLKQTFKDTSTGKQEYPNPKKVLRRSLMLPGWGQVTNKQAWKVPIVYGLLGGLSYYSVFLHKRYHDYRAAYYNLHPDTPDDNKFGPTPSYIPENSNLNTLQENRNFNRNRRDLVYVLIGLSYALNAIDAYVFAHLRPFDVSDDLSLNAKVQPGVITTSISEPVPSISLSINF